MVIAAAAGEGPSVYLLFSFSDSTQDTVVQVMTPFRRYRRRDIRQPLCRPSPGM
jgi:hypothetical protein